MCRVLGLICIMSWHVSQVLTDHRRMPRRTWPVSMEEKLPDYQGRAPPGALLLAGCGLGCWVVVVFIFFPFTFIEFSLITKRNESDEFVGESSSICGEWFSQDTFIVPLMYPWWQQSHLSTQRSRTSTCKWISYGDCFWSYRFILFRQGQRKTKISE